ncbi:hypothetical protein GLYMA_18G008400v4 [Glycine max]|nr:hypothetical protein GLYMA_18G008400v4 [Glycine max]KAH1152603.1 hypothetical protein GYH30_048629 [Glycine max]
MPQPEKSLDNNFPIIRIPGDGRCLFRSVVYGACLRSGEPSPSLSRQKELADELRAKVGYFILFRVVGKHEILFCRLWMNS